MLGSCNCAESASERVRYEVVFLLDEEVAEKRPVGRGGGDAHQMCHSRADSGDVALALKVISEDGKSTNLAPFSYFNVVCHDPPIFVLGFSGGLGKAKDSLANLLGTKECTLNIISEDCKSLFFPPSFLISNSLPVCPFSGRLLLVSNIHN